MCSGPQQLVKRHQVGLSSKDLLAIKGTVVAQRGVRSLRRRQARDEEAVL